MRYRLIIIILSLMASVAGATLLVYYKEYFYSVPALFMAGLSCFYLIKEYISNTKKITYMLNALENNDSSFRFMEKGGDTYNALFARTLNRINEMLANEKLNAREQEKYFELMLSNVITGIVTIDSKGNVIHSNNKALELLGLTVLTHISQLSRVDDSLYAAFTSEDKEESKSVTLYNERGEFHLSLKFAYISLRGDRMKIVSINDIGEELEEKEIESWTRLIRVLTHEIMNTVTPISSLSETLSMMVKQSDNLDNEHEKIFKQEIRQGLDVISLTSKGLISFVDSYRTLTRIPTPNRKPIYVKNLIHRVVTLIHDDLCKSGISPEIVIEDDSLMIYADENLVSQVMINIIKNGLAAMQENIKPRYIRIKVLLDKNTEDVIMEISNNGKPISKEDQDHIFVPFFTTKNTGTGIGLSISRQIMKQHSGALKLKCSNADETTFSLLFR